MKSNFGAIGNINLRGKKSATLSCGCCDMYDLRDGENERVAHREIDAAIIEHQHPPDDDDCGDPYWIWDHQNWLEYNKEHANVAQR